MMKNYATNLMVKITCIFFCVYLDLLENILNYDINNVMKNLS